MSLLSSHRARTRTRVRGRAGVDDLFRAILSRRGTARGVTFYISCQGKRQNLATLLLLIFAGLNFRACKKIAKLKTRGKKLSRKLLATQNLML